MSHQTHYSERERPVTEKMVADAKLNLETRERHIYSNTLQGTQRNEAHLSFSHLAAAVARHRHNAALLNKLIESAPEAKTEVADDVEKPQPWAQLATEVTALIQDKDVPQDQRQTLQQLLQLHESITTTGTLEQQGRSARLREEEKESDGFAHAISDLRRCKTDENFRNWKRRYNESEGATTAAGPATGPLLSSLSTLSTATGGHEAEGEEPSSPVSKAAARSSRSEPSSPVRPTPPTPFLAQLDKQSAAAVLQLFDSPVLYDGADPAPIRRTDLEASKARCFSGEDEVVLIQL